MPCHDCAIAARRGYDSYSYVSYKEHISWCSVHEYPCGANSRTKSP
ncbi:Protein of unknown function [Pyronema omphalodes CBS 100304]|uniref:Uncharacterized protein n=1 Tax=Pyronema omphalodes (strain CBS 100304) TaxID=1076935 RepID=U4LYJ8_PYROM|nr:Protein of unknown function [Pyronema omphalodes CBS 100304]